MCIVQVFSDDFEEELLKDIVPPSGRFQWGRKLLDQLSQGGRWIRNT